MTGHVPLPAEDEDVSFASSMEDEDDEDDDVVSVELDDESTPLDDDSPSPSWNRRRTARRVLVAFAAATFIGAAAALALLAPLNASTHVGGTGTGAGTGTERLRQQSGSGSVRMSAEDDEGLLLRELAERMRPRDLVLYQDAGQTPPKQFAHLHHMKTGGTSVNRLLRCAIDRLKTVRPSDSDPVKMFQVSECSQGMYQRCISGEDERCTENVQSSPIMSYCAPLFQTNQFGWNDADMITVLRHPVDRVWSMYRFETKGCFKCVPLLDIYRSIDNGTVEDLLCGGKPCERICVPQILDHQVRNLLTSPTSQDMTEDARLEEALYNMRNRFTVVGVTEELPTTARMIGHTFPWLAETYRGPGGGEAATGEGGVGEDAYTCSLPHANASPRNNHCGADGKSHWDLPDQPDQETRRAILEHNRLDMALYEAAARYFEMEKRALGWD